MKQVENILIWKWKQPNARFNYTSDQVNKFVEKLRENITLPVTYCCVTDDPEGLDESIKYIPLPEFGSDIRTETWDIGKGLPQCYRRLIMWAPYAEELFGKRYMMIDLDTIIVGNIDHLLTRQEDVLIFRGTNLVKRPYNGSLVIMDANARPEVFTKFSQEGAVESGKRFVGSDQAWISHCLSEIVDGKLKGTEVTIGEKEGVIHYSQRLVTKNGGWRNFTWPEGVCIVFFPGDFKIFYNGDTMGGRPYEKKLIRRLMGLPEKFIAGADNPTRPKEYLYAYNDPKRWGMRFKIACEEQGLSCRMFDRTRDVPSGSKCFVRVDQQGDQRKISKRIVTELNQRACKTLPTKSESILYDDKVAQFKLLEKFMPKTWLFTNHTQAADFAKQNNDWPIYSKSADGAGSATVRKLNNYEEAMQEAKKVFIGGGIKSAYNRKQQGYVLWQEFIPDTACTYRFNVIGDYIMGFRREHDEDGLPIPGQNPAMIFDTEQEREFAKISLEANDVLNSNWMCYDFLLDDRDGQFKLLECSSAWPTKPWFTVGKMFKKDFTETEYTGEDMFKIAARLVNDL